VTTVSSTPPRARPRASLASQVLGADPRQGPLPLLLLTLTAVTGLVDAVSILRLGRIFVANMTGNVVFTGFAITGAPGFSLSTSLYALAGFVAGALLGDMLIRRTGPDRALLLLAGAATELALVTAALVVAANTSVTGPVRGILAVLLALAMGVQNAVARRLAVPDMTTTVLTMTLTSIGADLRTARLNPALARRLLAVAAMLAGAVAGASLVLHVSTAASLAAAAALLVVVTAAAAAAVRRPGLQWRGASR
jgi:uncharacterized membrane protein YoaK (UPF0700 family)